MPSNNNANNESPANKHNFELQAKADEWLDVTPKEEVLQTELDRLKLEFEKCTDQLNACRLENSLLKDSKTELETETATLQSSLAQCRETVSQTRQELSLTQTHLMDAHASLQQKDKIMDQIQAEHTTELTQTQSKMESLQGNIERLEEDRTELKVQVSNLEDHKTFMKDQFDMLQDQLDQSKQETLDLNTKYEMTVTELDNQRKVVLESKSATGTIATLAETLRTEKSTLQRQLNETNQRLVECEKVSTERLQRIETLEEELAQDRQSNGWTIADLKTQLEDRTFQSTNLQEMVTKLEHDIEVSNDSHVELQAELRALQSHMTTMEAGRHEWLNAKTELEESLEESLSDLEVAQSKCVDLESQLVLVREECQHYKSLADEASATAAAANTVSAREEALLLKLANQQHQFECRLADIRNILGLKFTPAAIQSEVQLLRNDMMPSSFKVPLVRVPKID